MRALYDKYMDWNKKLAEKVSSKNGPIQQENWSQKVIFLEWSNSARTLIQIFWAQISFTQSLPAAYASSELSRACFDASLKAMSPL